MRDVALRLRSRGVFGLWSAEEPSADFRSLLQRVFIDVTVHEVRFHNPHIREIDSNWIILAASGART